MRKRLLFVSMLIVGFGMLGLFNSEVAYGKSFVSDQAEVLSDETEAYINQLNDDKFAQLYGEPEYAVITLSSLDSDIADAALELFNSYGIGKKAYNNGLLFVFAIEDREFRLQYGDGFAKVFEDRDGDDWVDQTAKDFLKAEDYDAALRYISERVYQEVQQLDENQGLANVYAAGPAFLTEKAEKKRQQGKVLLTLFVSLSAIVSGGTSGYFFFKQQRVKKAFEEHQVIPSHLMNSTSFQLKDFYKWANVNQKTFNKFKNKIDCLAGLKMYLGEEYLTSIIANADVFDAQETNLLQRALNNGSLKNYFAEEILRSSSYHLANFYDEVTVAEETLLGFENAMLGYLNEYLANYDFSNDIMAEKAALIPEYQKQVKKTAQQTIQEKVQHGDYLVLVLISGLSREDLDENIPTEVVKIVSRVKNQAIFMVDLEEVYKEHPEMRERLASYDDDDYDDIMSSVHFNGYSASSTNQLMLYTLLFNQANHQDTVIAEAQANSSSGGDFGGFGGGMSSGGGASGSW
ncbi:putative membrane protein YgcG [Enterococcus sp. PF1-24]|uniref:TPM domain-containing protein n=1 Tax=unclassified Enterococcus TaxID=2608891 RepID=UPI0024751CC2|nr:MULTISPECIES: TPM domain-containing protein [unclassified Enterococcus]MDH6365268.1 putative membrane protein YgcG [Enterococcus sp. PFB1-1]MDH6402402.1 putative membrane protein YgcG [Enterococcus sp. PF1-24]